MTGDHLDVAVVGAGIGGLGAALALSRAGHRVTLVERDDTPMPPDPEAAFNEWDRRGASQVRHPHVFLGLARTILRDRFPDVLRSLGELGIEPPPVGRNSGIRMDEATLELVADDDDLRMLPVRRTTFEWAMRRTVLAEPNVAFKSGVGVAGVELGAGDHTPPVVAGAELEDGTLLPADLVVAATGRRGDVPSWLAAHGIEVSETIDDCGVVYISRFYRAEKDHAFGFRAGVGAGVGFGVIGSDAGTYSITAVVDKDDKELRTHLTDNARFEATIGLLPELADVVAAGGEPIHPVHCMTGLINRTRRYTDGTGAPLVAGLVAVGDSHTCTNPAYGRGMSLALKQAVMLADALDATGGDVPAAGRLYERRSQDEVVPWYHLSVLTDQTRKASLASKKRPSASDGLGGLFAGARDPETTVLLLRVLNLLEPPSALLERMSELQARADEATKPAGRSGPRVKRPSRADLLAVVT